MKQSTELLQHRWISESIAHVSFVLSFHWVLSSIIAEAVKISPVFIALPPRPFKQACDEHYDGPDALYHHFVFVLDEIGCHITMKYSSTLCIHPSALLL